MNISNEPNINFLEEEPKIKFLDKEPRLSSPKSKVPQFIKELEENTGKWGVYGVFGKERKEMMNCSSRKHYLKVRYPDIEWAMTKNDDSDYILIGRVPA